METQPQAVADTREFQMYWMVIWMMVHWRRDHGADASEIALNPADYTQLVLPDNHMFGVHAVPDDSVAVGCARLS